MTSNLRVIVYHSGYGCDTGCCGHTVALTQSNGTEVESSFIWEHPDDDANLRAWAEKRVTEKFGSDHVADLDWDNCIIESYDTCPM